jgi:hypothetical protein
VNGAAVSRTDATAGATDLEVLAIDASETTKSAGGSTVRDGDAN